MGALLSFLGGLLAKLLGLWKAQPSRVEVVGREAATAETKLQTVEAMNAQIAQAVQAQRQSDAAIAAHPDELRDPSPDSRD